MIMKIIKSLIQVIKIIFICLARTPNAEGLDYAFKHHKNKINVKDKKKMEEYIFDLENTWILNLDMLETMFPDIIDMKQEEKTKIFKVLQRIKDLFNKKKYLKNEKMNLRGKVLMDKQIMEECRRRNEENSAYYEEQIEEFKENADKKESFTKQFEKKFNEVEIYVQREAKTLSEKPKSTEEDNKNNNIYRYDNLLGFEIVAFITNNEMLHRRQMSLRDEIKIIRDDMNELLKENVELKKREEYIDMSEEYDNQISKYNSLIKLYKGKIKYMQRNNEHLKSVLKSLNSRFENLNTNKLTLEKKLKTEIKTKISPPRNKRSLNDNYNSNKKSIGQLLNNMYNKNRVVEEDNNQNDDDGSREENNDTIVNLTIENNEKQAYMTDQFNYNTLICKQDFDKLYDGKDVWDISCIETNNDQ
jgi:hypothetical protein